MIPLRVSTYRQTMVRGAVILPADLINRLQQKR